MRYSEIRIQIVKATNHPYAKRYVNSLRGKKVSSSEKCRKVFRLQTAKEDFFEFEAIAEDAFKIAEYLLHQIALAAKI